MKTRRLGYCLVVIVFLGVLLLAKLPATGSVGTELNDVPVGVEQNFTWDGKDSVGAPVDSGSYSIDIEASDKSGNSSEKNVPVVVDVTAPTISLPAPAPGAETGALATVISVRIEDNDDGWGLDSAGLFMCIDVADATACNAGANMGAWDATTERLSYNAVFEPAGGNTHSVTVVAEDKLKNKSVYTWNFTVDDKAPVVSFNELKEGAYVRGSYPITGIAGDNLGGTGVDRVELIVGNEVVSEYRFSQSNPGPTAYLDWNTEARDLSHQPKYPDGQYTLKLVAYDKMGNESAPVTMNVTVDNTPPALNGVSLTNSGYFSPSPNGNSSHKTMSVAPAVTEANPFKVKLEVGTGDYGHSDGWVEAYAASRDFQGGVQIAAPVIWDGKKSAQTIAADGEYFYYLTVTDAAGNSVQTGGALVVDTAAPSVGITMPTSGDALVNTIEFRVNASDGEAGSGIADNPGDLPGAGVWLRALRTDNGSQWLNNGMSYSAGGGYYEYFWPTTPDFDGEYGITATAYDRAGNYTTAPAAGADPFILIVANRPVSIVSVKAVPNPFSRIVPPGTTTLEFEVYVRQPGLDAASWDMVVDLADADRNWTGVLDTDPSTEKVRTGKQLTSRTWDGLDGSGSPAADDEYDFTVTVTPSVGDPVSRSGKTALDSTPPVIETHSVTPGFFTPNADGKDDTALISAGVREVNKYTAVVDIYCDAGFECESVLGAGKIHSMEIKVDPKAQGLDLTSASYSWNGMIEGPGGVQLLAPDSKYRYAFKATDWARNESGVSEGVFVKDNPPVITLEEQYTAFSPNNDTNKDSAPVEWGVDEEGLFTVLVCGNPNNCSESNALAALERDITVAVEGATSWSGMIDPATRFDEGTYWAVVSGKDSDSVDAFGNAVDNKCVSKTVEVVLDVTAPTVTEFYPREDEFTWLRPKIKVDVRDDRSGFTKDPVWAGAHTQFGITGFGGVLETNIIWSDEKAYRAWTRPSPALDEGPHFLSVSIEDFAGNFGHLDINGGATRFVAIPPLADDFSGDELNPAKWIGPNLIGDAAPVVNTLVVGGGGIAMQHQHTEADDGSAPLDVYGMSFGGRGVYDISRAETVIEVKGLSVQGSGTTYEGGIGIECVNEAFGSAHAVIYVLVGGHINKEGTPAEGILIWSEGNYSVVPPIFQLIPLANPQASVDLKVFYEEGNLVFSVAGSEVYSTRANITHAAVGIVGISGFREGAFSSSFVSVGADDFNSYLAAPVLDSVNVMNADNPTSDGIAPGQRYDLEVTGTRWQKHLEGRIANRLASSSDYEDLTRNDVNGITVGGVEVLTEAAPGIYRNQTPVVLNSLIDASGRSVSQLAPFANTDTFDAYPLHTANYIIDLDSHLTIRTNAVERVVLENTDYPSGYTHIQIGEHYKITAETLPGNWNIYAYLLNADAGSGNDQQEILDAVIRGPVKMMKVRDGRYEAKATFDTDLDSEGRNASTVIAWLVYGSGNVEIEISENSLSVGEPEIKTVTVLNHDREGVEDISLWETAEIIVQAQTGLSLTTVLYNPDRDDCTGFACVIAGPANMTEDSNNPGAYKALLTLKADFDYSGGRFSKVSAYVQKTNDSSASRYSWNQLGLLEVDDIEPGKPRDSVVVSSVEEEPSAGEQIETTLTWTLPSWTDDLAGFNIYRVTHVTDSGEITTAAGSPPLSLARTESNRYSLDSTALNYGGTDCNQQLEPGATAYWYEKGTVKLLPLPLVDSGVIDSGKDVYAYIALFDTLGVLYPNTGQNYYLTIYSQEKIEELDRWIRYLKRANVADADTRIYAYTKAFTGMLSGTFVPVGSLSALDYYHYENANDALVEGVGFTDAYSYTGSLYSYAITALDQSMNESLPSNIASVPLSSKSIVSATLFNAQTPPGITIKDGDEYVAAAAVDGTSPIGVNLYIVNLDALERKSAFQNAIVDGPFALQNDGQNGYALVRPLENFVDAVGGNASRLRAVLKTGESGELVTADNILHRNLFDGTLSPDRQEYISGEMITVDYSAENVSDAELENIGLTIRLVDPVTGAAIAETPGPVVATLSPGTVLTGALQIDTPAELTLEKNHLLQLVATFDGREYVVSGISIHVVPEKVLISGELMPETIIQYQEPYMNYRVHNRTLGTISSGIVSGVIVPQGWTGGSPPISQFTEPIVNLSEGNTISKTNRFESVAADPGLYDVVLFYRKNESAQPEEAFRTQILVEMCAP